MKIKIEILEEIPIRQRTAIMLSQIEVLQGQGKAIAMACKEAATTEQLRDDCLNGEIFYSLKEAHFVIENWRILYTTKCPHSALGYRPPAPLTIASKPTPFDERLPTQ